MTRGTFANIKLFNKFIGKPAPKTIHFPSGQTVRMYIQSIQALANQIKTCIKDLCVCFDLQLDVFEAAELYQKEGIPLIILAGKKYGSGNSRDWAAKGPYLLVSILKFCFLKLQSVLNIPFVSNILSKFFSTHLDFFMLIWIDHFLSE